MSDTPINTSAAANKLAGFLNRETKPEQMHADELTGMLAAEMLTNSVMFVRSQGLHMLNNEYRTYFDSLTVDDFKSQGIVGLVYGRVYVYLLPEDTEMAHLFALYKDEN